MTSTKNIIWTISGLTVIFTLITVDIITIAGNYNIKLSFGLLTILGFLALAIYFIRHKKQVAVRDNYFYNIDEYSYPSQIKHPPTFINYIKIQEKDLKVFLGNSRCSQPYHASILNTATINNNAFNTFFIPPVIRKSEPVSLDKHITQDEISTYCLNAVDLVWQIGPEYLGCRKELGYFNAEQFKKNVVRPNVKMIELKLSDISNSGYYSVLSGDFLENKNGNLENKDVLLSKHTAFRCAEGMILFIGKLQELSGGKPVGFKLFINDKKEFYEICYAIRKTHIMPDFIVVDSPDDISTGNRTKITGDNGVPLYEALQFVSKTLQHYGLDKEIKIIAAGKINSGFDVLKMIALGADSVYNYAPGLSNTAYQKRYMKKSHNDAIKTLIGIMKVCGFKNKNDITLAKLFSRLDMLPLITAEESYNQKPNAGTVKIINHSKLKMKVDVYKKQSAVL